jgi:hypothetical protein
LRGIRLTGVPENMRTALFETLASDEQAVDETAREVKNLGIDGTYMGGLFSMDGVHPTKTGYAAIANCILRIMKKAAASNTAFGGMSTIRLNVADLYDLGYMYQRDPLRRMH